jgi:hypothetical protein
MCDEMALNLVGLPLIIRVQQKHNLTRGCGKGCVSCRRTVRLRLLDRYGTKVPRNLGCSVCASITAKNNLVRGHGLVEGATDRSLNRCLGIEGRDEHGRR